MPQCSQCKSEGKGRYHEKLWVNVFCDKCWGVWKSGHGYDTETVPAKDPAKDPMTTEERAKSKKPNPEKEYCTTCHGERSADGWCDCTREAAKPVLPWTPDRFSSFDSAPPTGPVLGNPTCPDCGRTHLWTEGCDCEASIKRGKENLKKFLDTSFYNGSHVKAPTVTKSLNNMYTIEVMHPLIRPGLKITTEASEKYVAEVVAKIMSIVREINK